MIEKVQLLDRTVDTIRQSIVNKNVPLEKSDGFKSYPEAVRQISYVKQEELKPTIHGVNYYDYNGDLLYVYTPQEFLALSAHPSQPTHAGLVADGWNWDLTDAQDFIENTCDCLNIGAHYITDTGDTRVYFTIPEDMDGELGQRGVYYRQSKANGLTIDWGDGTVEESNNVVNRDTQIYHTYTHSGKYVLKITPQEDCIYTLGNNASYTGIFGYYFTFQRPMAEMINKVEIGKNVSFQYGCPFRWTANVETVTFPKTIYHTTIANYFFVSCTNLKCIVIPEGIQNLGGNYFGIDMFRGKVICFSKTVTLFNGSSTCLYCDSVILPNSLTTLSGAPLRYGKATRRIFIPDGVSFFPQYAIADLPNLEELHLPNNPEFTTLTAYLLVNTGLHYLEIPESITSMGNQCCYGMCLEEVIMRPTVPPSAATINIFDSRNVYLKIYVPYSADHSILNAYKTATNWTTYASKIYELDENGNIPND